MITSYEGQRACFCLEQTDWLSIATPIPDAGRVREVYDNISQIAFA